MAVPAGISELGRSEPFQMSATGAPVVGWPVSTARMVRSFPAQGKGNHMTRTRKLIIGAAFPITLAALAAAQISLESRAAAQSKGAVQAPRFEVDPLWPKPLPNHWLLGMTIGVSVDKQDHIWIIHR